MEQRGERAALRALPSADRVLRSPEVTSLLAHFRREPVVRLVRQVLAAHRSRVQAGGEAPSLAAVVTELQARTAAWRPGPVPVINATGVILHTNLGRAPLSRDALAAAQAAAAYSDLELDLASGERGSRQMHVQTLLQVLTGAEASHVAVNNAAGVTLVLAALCRGKEVVVSRGQAVEIGGGFRVPVILRQSGARLVEVGTTNRTRPADYEEAIGPRTGALLHVHSSNFRIDGFTESVALPELVALARRHGVPVIDDNGSGALLETADFGLGHEPTPLESLRAGVEVVAFSGDKLLGGPQCGILLGRADLLARLSRHPLARALRPDKLTLAALSATLAAYLRQDGHREIPVWAMIGLSADELRRRAEAWRARAATRGLAVDLEPAESTVGGGSLPGETLPTTVLVLPREVQAASLRAASPPVVGRTRGGRVLLDLRTVPPDREGDLLEAVVQAAPAPRSSASPVLDSSAR